MDAALHEQCTTIGKHLHIHKSKCQNHHWEEILSQKLINLTKLRSGPPNLEETEFIHVVCNDQGRGTNEVTDNENTRVEECQKEQLGYRRISLSQLVLSPAKIFVQFFLRKSMGCHAMLHKKADNVH